MSVADSVGNVYFVEGGTGYCETCGCDFALGHARNLSSVAQAGARGQRSGAIAGSQLGRDNVGDR